MLKNVWMWILNNLFHVTSETKQKELEDNQKYAMQYESTLDINFNAIFSNKLANYVVSDSNLEVLGENVRAKYLNMLGNSMWKKMKKITGLSFGFGGVLLVPYVKGGKIYYNIVTQNRLSIDKTDGDLITGATILAERKEIKKNNNQSKVFLRWTNYRLNNGTMTIEQRFTDENGKSITTPDFWKNIPVSISITGVDRVLFGYIKSPINNRRSNDMYGVPITYGCDSIINEIKECLEQIKREFKLKEVFIGADVTMFNREGGLPTTGLYKKIDSGEDSFWEIFDPAIRDVSYYNRLQELYRRLEHSIGTSAGILSEVNTQNATATEIRRAMYDTFTIVDDMRSSIEKGLEDFFYACNVLANAYNLSPRGEYNLSYDWSYSLMEDSRESFEQMSIGVDKNVIGKAELRNWLIPTETMEESEERVKELEEKNPSIKDLVGIE